MHFTLPIGSNGYLLQSKNNWNMTMTEIATAFSSGEFEKIYNFISDNAKWTVIEEEEFEGKQAIIENCWKVANYFKTVTIDFQTIKVISENNNVVINGTAEFLKEGERISFIYACDLYEFNNNNKIQKITSYCIPNK